MNDLTPIGHNNPPDPIEIVTAEYDAVISEAQNWADGEPVENQEQMKAVDAVLKEFKSYKSALAKAGKERTAPLHSAWKDEVAAVKVYTDDADRLQSALVACVAPFKAKLAAEKEAERQAAWKAAEDARIAAEKEAAAANPASVDDLRDVDQARIDAVEAEKAAQKAQRDTVKGMRTVTHHEVTDMRLLVNWIASNDKAAMAEFATEYARRNYKSRDMAGVRVWQTKEAF